MELDRILLIDKPQGWTSFDVVAKIRGSMQNKYNLALRDTPELCGCEECKAEVKRRASLTSVRRASTGTSNAAITHQTTGNDQIHSDYPRRRHKIRVGHTGTLDPMATGLLVIVTGKNTKMVSEMIKHDKTYEVELTLGSISDTGDAEGKLTNLNKLVPDALAVDEAVLSFVGEIMQTPPAYSAIKINGKRAYQLAREGKEVRLEPRKVNIYSILDIKYEYPVVSFVAEVSSGTYIRSLVQDIGQMLGTGAYMSGLRRTKVGEYDIDDATEPESLELA
ncbi:tRNA pseudouridine(55) synthase TruB [Candidatus Saccharibacteria bacterium]|nr:tRNA pseudouridine(55) synthase TruB [Candidatus Saccharibacteria bacterium]MCB9821197.1 tRNA pseudouridine(55) synthase TruB [Candidatus Nomurabacteria bacterium]